MTVCYVTLFCGGVDVLTVVAILLTDVINAGLTLLDNNVRGSAYGAQGRSQQRRHLSGVAPRA
jgi:hypothetical protein